MEGFLIILGIAVWIIGPFRILGWIFGAAANTVAPDSKIAGSWMPKDLQVSVEQGTSTFDGKSFECFKVKMRGKISAPYQGFSYQMIVHLTDVTDGEAKPILCAIDQLQEPDTIAFEFRTDAMPMPYADAVMTEWVELATIPIDVLTPPRAGNRKLKCRLDVVDANSPPLYVVGSLFHAAPGSILAFSESSVDFYSADHGYEDVNENRQKLTGMMIKLAMAVSASDGSMDASEGDIIRHWLLKQIGHMSEGEAKSKEKQRLNGIVAEAYEEAKSNSIDIPGVCRQVKEIASTGDCYDCVELCLHVAAADGEAEGAELQMCRGIANFLDVNLDRLRSMEEKIVPVSMHKVQQDSESLVGITTDMSPEEIRKHLNNEYRKWNSRSTHNDETVREQAKRMLEIIADCRRKYVS